ncbi:MAG: BPL-N domain-containing protein [Polyangiaceae bacterium]
MAGLRALSVLVAGLGAASGCRAKGGVPLTSQEKPPILLFVGSGTSPQDVAAFEALLSDGQQRYSEADSDELNAMSEAQLRAYRLFIMPGGNFLTIGESLKPATITHVRDAVRHGVSYLGTCAGAFLASTSSHYRSFGFATGVQFKFYAAEAKGLRKAAVKIAGASTPPIDVYWEDGPELTGWGAVVARYPDRTPAVVEGTVDDGWVVLSGVHAEAPESWRRSLSFDTPRPVALAFARSLVASALNRRPLPHD